MINSEPRKVNRLPERTTGVTIHTCGSGVAWRMKSVAQFGLLPLLLLLGLLGCVTCDREQNASSQASASIGKKIATEQAGVLDLLKAISMIETMNQREVEWAPHAFPPKFLETAKRARNSISSDDAYSRELQSFRQTLEVRLHALQEERKLYESQALLDREGLLVPK